MQIYNSPAFQAGYLAGVKHPAYLTGVMPDDLVPPYANGAARERWLAGFRAAIQ